VIRGMAPRNEADINQLIKIEVSDVLIFKIDTKGEVDKEIDILERKGINQKNISHIDFPWKDISDYRSVCEMTIDALKILETADTNNRKIYFHCTVGEDRTGYLAGLYKIYRANQSVDDVFQSELCDKGYEAGDPNKISTVVQEVRANLTPAFLTMADLIKKNKVLNKKLCAEFDVSGFAENLKTYKCKKSKLIK
jgi:protein tyrosine phosphatase